MQSIRSWWEKFALKHKLIAQFVKFYVFSMLVTVLQYLLLTFLPSFFYRYTDWFDIPVYACYNRAGYFLTGQAAKRWNLSRQWRKGVRQWKKSVFFIMLLWVYCFVCFL